MGGVKKAISKPLSITYFKIKGNCSLKAINFDHFYEDYTVLVILIAGAYIALFPRLSCPLIFHESQLPYFLHEILKGHGDDSMSLI